MKPARRGPARTSPAELPPPDLAGLDPAWSRLVETVQPTGPGGVTRTWHCLDSRPAGDPAPPAFGTLVCVHGNPTWSYLWRRLLAAAPPGWRVVALDHLGMGYSERIAEQQRLADRVADLGAVLEALDVTGPVVTVAHDWGGAISLGWAVSHREQLAGMVLLNTAISQPPGSPVPALIALARTPGVLRTSCVTSPTFLRGTLRLAHPQLPAQVRAGYLAPYDSADRRVAIGDFVEDIPLTGDHPSRATLDAVANGLGSLAVPVLLLWGTRDPVFSDRYLRDLVRRLPQAEVHRYQGAGHLLAEDRDLATPIAGWLAARVAPALTGGSPATSGEAADRPADRAADAGTAGARPLWAALDDRAGDDSPAIVELGDAPRTVTFAQLATSSRALAAGLAQIGVRPGDRVALLVPPGADLAAVVYACWRIGAVIVLADAGLGVRGMSRALRGAAPRYLVGIPKALAAARALRWPGEPIAVGPVSQAGLVALGARQTLDDVRRRGGPTASTPAPDLPPAPGPDAEAAVLFTSGATGPAKGVVYRHRQLQAQRDLLAAAYAITPDDRLVAAFAPFALYGAALGIASIVPDMDVTAPATLSATALAEAVAALDATLVFSSPAALVNVAATSGALSPLDREALAGVRLLLSAGAPVPAALLRTITGLLPAAQAHTPYGMTEVLPVTDVTLAEIEAAGGPAGPGHQGVCVGRPLPGVQVALRPLDDLGRPETEPTDKPGVTGEICVGAPHVKDRYDQLWATDHASVVAADTHPGWHRTGDVGHLDDDGRLWVEGRLVHVLTTAAGVVTPVGVEQRLEALAAVRSAAVVGVGPPGAQVVAVVVTPRGAPGPLALRAPLADPALAAEVRAAAAPVEVAAVLVTDRLPVDIRHNSKVDRTRVALWAARALSGERVRRRP